MKTTYQIRTKYGARYTVMKTDNILKVTSHMTQTVREITTEQAKRRYGSLENTVKVFIDQDLIAAIG